MVLVVRRPEHDTREGLSYFQQQNSIRNTTKMNPGEVAAIHPSKETPRVTAEVEEVGAE